MTLILFHSYVDGANTNVIVDTKIKQGPTLSPGLGRNQVIKGDVMGNNQIFLDVEQSITRYVGNFAEFLGQILPHEIQEIPYGIALLAPDVASMARPIPVGVGNV